MGRRVHANNIGVLAHLYQPQLFCAFFLVHDKDPDPFPWAKQDMEDEMLWNALLSVIEVRKRHYIS